MPKIIKIEISKDGKVFDAIDCVPYEMDARIIYKCYICDYVGRDIENDAHDEEIEKIECPKCHSRDIHPL